MTQSLRKSLLIIADDLLPLPEVSAGAPGSRAWNLGCGLQSHGLRPDYAVRTTWQSDRSSLPPAQHMERRWNSMAELDEIIRDLRPEVILNCSYPSMLPASAHESLIVQDSSGPRWMEGLYWNSAQAIDSAWREAGGYSDADYFICAGERQKMFFYPWLALSGFDLRDTSRVHVVRPGKHAPPPERHVETKRIFFSGSLLPWTDPRLGWRIAREEVEKADALFVLVAARRNANNGAGFLEEDLVMLGRSKNCCVMKPLPYDAFAAELAQATVAMDVMARNPERELAFSTRDVEYLWAGVPIITHDFGEVGELVARHNAGWAVPPDDEAAIRRAVREALLDSSVVEEKARNARTLHDRILHPLITTRILAEICTQGTRRPGRRTRRPSRSKKILAGKTIWLKRRLEGV